MVLSSYLVESETMPGIVLIGEEIQSNLFGFGGCLGFC